MKTDTRENHGGVVLAHLAYLSHLASTFTFTLVLIAFAGACRTYEPLPFDPAEALRRLEQVSLEAPPKAPTGEGGPFDLADGLSASEAAALALRLNPGLRAARARVGVAKAELVEAGLLADVEIGFGAGDVIADGVFDGTTDGQSVLTGVSLLWELPRPGEIEAKEQLARAGVEEVQSRALQRELEVVRDVHLAHVRLLAAEARLDLNGQILALARRTYEHFETARVQGAATALQASLARIALGGVELEALRLQSERSQAGQALSAVIGLPPATELKLEGDLRRAAESAPASPEALVERALSRRPDLRALRAEYESAEAALRLEVVRQWPQIAIGTGIAIGLPIFRRWNAPAIDAALRRRELVYQELEAQVHELRRDVHASHALSRRTVTEIRFFEGEIGPQLSEALRLSGNAFSAKEVTLFEVLTAQSQVAEVRARLLDARARYAEARVLLDASTGALVGAPASGKAANTDKESKR
jgi:outer membrane protein TolC